MAELPVITDKPADCFGCGVCCLHMGYPAFVKPQPPLTEQAIEADERLRQFAKDPRTRQRLLQGSPGEAHWHRLPEHLRTELEQFEENYQAPAQGELDGPCIWLNPETMLCSHHEYRPNVCRDFETGCQQCLDWRRFYADRIE